MLANKRPIYLNLFKIRLPITGMVSLAHRASGVLLFLAIPLAAYLLELSVTSRDGFDYVMNILQQPALKVLMLALVWGLAHHLFAGIRFLLIDADIGVEKSSSRTGAWLVIAAELMVVAGFVFGAWL
ncbi:MAG: succinate dehydrogenase, cytochrome b556 subunit [Gammaproteobacteria bacterium]